MDVILTLLLFFFPVEGEPWTSIQIDPELEELAVDPTDWTYPWHVIKHEGYFENTFGEPITEEDTAHIVRNSFCNLVTYYDARESSKRLPFARANWRNDTLQVSIFQSNASEIVAMEIDILEEKFTPRFKIFYIQEPEEQSTEYLEQSLTLQKLPKKGQPIKGEVDILMREWVKWPDREFERLLRVKGTFVIE